MIIVAFVALGLALLIRYIYVSTQQLSRASNNFLFSTGVISWVVGFVDISLFACLHPLLGLFAIFYVGRFSTIGLISGMLAVFCGITFLNGVF